MTITGWPEAAVRRYLDILGHTPEMLGLDPADVENLAYHAPTAGEPYAVLQLDLRGARQVTLTKDTHGVISVHWTGQRPGDVLPPGRWPVSIATGPIGPHVVATIDATDLQDTRTKLAAALRAVADQIDGGQHDPSTAAPTAEQLTAALRKACGMLDDLGIIGATAAGQGERILHEIGLHP